MIKNTYCISFYYKKAKHQDNYQILNGRGGLGDLE